MVALNCGYSYPGQGYRPMGLLGGGALGKGLCHWVPKLTGQWLWWLKTITGDH